MKNKGISLIVLIITIVVIIILGTAIIVNVAKTNIIERASEAVVKQDFKAFQDELTMYITDEFVNTEGKFKAEELTKTSKDEVVQIISSIKDTKYEDYVIIENGEIKILDTMPEPDKTWAKEALGATGDSNNGGNKDNTAPTTPTSLELTSTSKTITAVAGGSTDDSSFVYEYSIDNTNWQESGEFTGLTQGTEYTIYARAKDSVGNISEVKQNKIDTLYDYITDNNKPLHGTTPSYSNPIIPVDFRPVQTEDASWKDSDGDGIPDGWNNGLVIQDRSLNEFVWIPCTLTDTDATVQYKIRIDYPKNGLYSGNQKIEITESSLGKITEAIPVADETTQISNYGGFYIGRYEAGVPENQTEIDGTSSTPNISGMPTVKANQKVWTYVSLTKAIESAKMLHDTQFVKSGIPTGEQWDTLCAWLEEAQIDVEDSRTWGNYSDSTSPANITGFGKKQETGYSDVWKAKNIYDIAGNVLEWTAETFAAWDWPFNRGGYCTDSGSDHPAAYRNSSTYDGRNTIIGFRVVLYVI